MKDIVLKGNVIRRELLVALCCVLLSFCINVVAVIVYAKPWTEIFTQIGYVVVIGVVFYCIMWVFRLLYLAIKKLITKL
ncbi:MAG TPA: hypothetical protein DHU75_02245 [Rikenellaceae bacterium]|nr:hypothetical protein [Rikenellaceae bacterium]